MAREAVVVGAGAAGLATAIFAKRRHPELSVTLLDGAKKPGAKILVSGGGRCNVTNTIVAAEDFQGGSRNVVRRLLRDIAQGRSLGDTTTLADAAVVDTIRENSWKAED